jgi:ThiF family
MSRAAYSIALPGRIALDARAHLLRSDAQEDICFALWHPSRGRTRTTALINRLLIPTVGDRKVHGNASFEPRFFERAMSEAAKTGAGLALMHSHPRGAGWQGMSRDDVKAEQGNAGAVLGATGRPFVGLTLAGDGAWSGRFWLRTAPSRYARQNCATVRTVGENFGVTFMDELAPPPLPNGEQIRTVSAWGEEAHGNLVRLRVGVVGAGSVGGLVADSLVRTGFEDVILIDFDRIEEHNLDRLSYATRSDIGKLKVKIQATYLAKRATADPFRVQPFVASVFEDEGFRAALDCDLLFACVDRPCAASESSLKRTATVGQFTAGETTRGSSSGKH